MHPCAGTQSESAPSPVTDRSSTEMVNQDSSWRSATLHSFDAIRLSEMDDVALLCRSDTKYILGEEQLSQVLAGLTGHYQILEIDGRWLHRYRTLYFDTSDLALYLQHHSGWRNRYKVRQRAYADSGLTFLEVKQKTNGHTTVKSRMQIPALCSQIAPDAKAFLRTTYPYPVEALEPKLLNTFQRLTLVSMHSVERVTVDVGLCFLWNDAHVSLAGIAVAEVKQDGFSADSQFVRQMRASGVGATGISKYCIGVSMLYPEVKHNSFEPQLRQIARLVHEGRPT